MEKENLKLQYQVSNGTWYNCQERIAGFFKMAINDSIRMNEFNPEKFFVLNETEIVKKLSAGSEVRIGTDWNDNIRSLVAVEKIVAERQAKIKPEIMRKCNCGHTIPSNQVMSASMGTSCPDCYDRMSE